MEDVSTPPSQIGRGSLCSALLISVTGVVVASFAITLYHFIMIRYCIRRRAAMAAAAAAAGAAQPRTFTGVDEKILETIPIFPFTAVKSGIDQDECVVCLGELEDGDTVRLLPTCNHAFHVTCIDQWFAAQTTCPLCRYPIVDEERNPEPSVSDAPSTDDSDRETINSPISVENSNRESSPMELQPLQLLLHHPSPSVDRRPPPPLLKRSLSLDPSLICTDLQRNNLSSFSSRTALRRSGSFSSTWYPSHFDRRGLLSAKWLRSLSRLRAGKGTTNGTILPY